MLAIGLDEQPEDPEGGHALPNDSLVSHFLGGGKNGSGPAHSGDNLLYQTPGGADDGKATVLDNEETATGTEEEGTGRHLALVDGASGLITCRSGEEEVQSKGVATQTCISGAIASQLKNPRMSILLSQKILCIGAPTTHLKPNPYVRSAKVSCIDQGGDKRKGREKTSQV